MFNFDYITKEDKKEHNPNWPEIPDHSCKILIVGDSQSGKTNALLNLINHEPDIDHFYYTNFRISQYFCMLNIRMKRESTGLKYLNDSKALIVYSNQ